MLRGELPSPHPAIQLQIRLIRWSSNGTGPRPAPSPNASVSGQTARPYAYSVRAVVPAATARRSAGLAEQDRRAFVQALRKGIAPSADAEFDEGSRDTSRELWAGENHSLTSVADNLTGAVQWEIRGYKVKLARGQVEQLIATLEAVPELAERLIHRQESCA